MNKVQELKSAVTTVARGILEGRKTTPDLEYSGYYLIEEVSNGYELKVLQDLHKEIKTMVTELEGFGMDVNPMNYVKLEVLETRIAAVKGMVSETARVNRMIG